MVNNNAGNGDHGLAALLKAGRVRKIICSFPRQVDSYVFDELYRSGKLELELVPQGNLAERIRAAGAGIGAFFCPTGYGTELAKGKETREIDGRQYVLEYPIHGDVALIKAERGDRWGNLIYRMSARNFGPVMATAAKQTVATVHEIVELGDARPGSGRHARHLRQQDREDRRASPRRPAASGRRPEHGAPETHQGPAGRARGAGHPRRRLRQPRHRHADRWWPTTSPPAARSSCTARTASWAWARRRPPAQEDYDLINAGKQPVTLLPGGAYFHHADSFAMMRGGHLDICVLGAFQVSATGDLANWSTGEPGAIPAVGGAMDLAIGAKQTWVMMDLLTKQGESKVVERCSYPLTGVGCVKRIYTDLCTLECTPQGLKLIDRRRRPGPSPNWNDSWACPSPPDTPENETMTRKPSSATPSAPPSAATAARCPRCAPTTSAPSRSRR